MKWRRTATLTILGLLITLPLQADWVWSPETGWVNTKYKGSTTSRGLQARGEALLEKKEYSKAAEAFQNIEQMHPDSPEGEEALFLAGNAHLEARRYDRAHDCFNRFLDRYPASDRIREVVDREYKIALALLQPETKSFIGFRLVSSKQLALEILRRVIATIPYGQHADEAQLTIANYYFREKFYFEAQTEYRELRKKYPQSAWTHFSLYQIGRCDEALFEGVKYDTSPLESAQKSFEEYLRVAPEGNHLAEVNRRLIRINKILAEKELTIARFYLQRKRYRTARIYLEAVLSKYPQAPTSAEARRLLSKTKPAANR